MTETELLIIDVEATCWQGNPPPGQISEIIEIGLCRADLAEGKILEKRSILVRPERSTVSAFCTELTTLTPEMVADGITFAEACALLVREYDAPNHAWASYGDYDRKQFDRQCKAFDVSYPFGATHINVKRAFGAAKAEGRAVGMAGALRMLSLPLEGTHHRGADDAVNIAQIAIRLFQEGGWAALPTTAL